MEHDLYCTTRRGREGQTAFCKARLFFGDAAKSRSFWRFSEEEKRQPHYHTQHMGFADELAARAAAKKQHLDVRNVGPIIASSPVPEGRPSRYKHGEINDHVVVVNSNERPSTTSSLFAEQLKLRNASARRRRRDDEHTSSSREGPRCYKHGLTDSTSSRKEGSVVDRPMHIVTNDNAASSSSILIKSVRSSSLPIATADDNSTFISSQSTREDGASMGGAEDGTIQTIQSTMGSGRIHRMQPGNDTAASTNDAVPENPIFGAWAQIEQLKRRVRDAEESALQERRRADNVAFELRLVKQGQEIHPGSWANSSVGGGSDEVAITTPMRSPEEGDCNSIERAHEGHASEMDERIEKLSGRMLPHSPSSSAVARGPNCHGNPITVSSAASTAISSTTATLFATPSHLEDAGAIIRLKNAEIDVLRSQVRRLEMRVQEAHDLNSIDEDVTLTQSFHYGGLPLEVAMERTLAHPEYVTSRANATPIDELRSLRDDVQTLKRQLGLKGGIVNDAGGGKDPKRGSASSSREGHDNNEYAENCVEREMEEEEGGTPSSWGLCCFRGRRRSGYGRV